MGLKMNSIRDILDLNASARMDKYITCWNVLGYLLKPVQIETTDVASAPPPPPQSVKRNARNPQRDN